MDSFDDIEEKTRHRGKEVEAREIKARLKEIETELEKIPVTPTHQNAETVTPTTVVKSRSFLEQMSDVGQFVLIIFSVIMAIRVAAWVGFAIMIGAVIWISYKLFLGKKS